MRLLRVVLGTEIDPGDVFQAHERAVRLRAQDDLSELLRAQESPWGTHRVGELPSWRGRLISDLARRIDDVLRRDGVRDIGHRQLELCEGIGSHPDPHGVVRSTEDPDLADPWDAGKLVFDVDRDVVGEEVMVPGPMGGLDGEDEKWDPDGL